MGLAISALLFTITILWFFHFFPFVHYLLLFVAVDTLMFCQPLWLSCLLFSLSLDICHFGWYFIFYGFTNILYPIAYSIFFLLNNLFCSVFSVVYFILSLLSNLLFWSSNSLLFVSVSTSGIFICWLFSF